MTVREKEVRKSIQMAMAPHIHDPTITLDGRIQCRDCGETLTNAEREITKVNSATRVRGVLEEIAMAGQYVVTGQHDGFPVYSRKLDNNITEEVTGEKLADRSYKVYKILSMGGD